MQFLYFSDLIFTIVYLVNKVDYFNRLFKYNNCAYKEADSEKL